MPEEGTLPEDIPLTPSNTYRGKGWLSLGDWLGTGAVASALKVFRPFEEGREFARNLKLKSQTEWERQKWFLAQLSGGGKTRVNDLAQHWKVSRVTAKRDIADLKNRGVIEYVGAPKTGWYRRK